MTHAGTVAIIGRPNAGKSTLLNTILAAPASIVTPKPHTTRQPIKAIWTKDTHQIVFVDTPGINPNAQTLLSRNMNQSISAHLASADVVVWLLAIDQWSKEEHWILEILPKDRPVILVMNKVDQLKDKDQLLPMVERIKDRFDFSSIYAISATKGTQVIPLVEAICEALPLQPFLFPLSDEINIDPNVHLSELIRQPLMEHLEQELPYQTKVTIDKQKVKNKVLHLHATIWVEKPGQKMIIIGKNGSMIKTIGKLARKKIEAHRNQKVMLNLWVRVQPGWTNDPEHIDISY